MSDEQPCVYVLHFPCGGIADNCDGAKYGGVFATLEGAQAAAQETYERGMPVWYPPSPIPLTWEKCVIEGDPEDAWYPKRQKHFEGWIQKRMVLP